MESIMVAICGVLSGAESWSEMEEFRGAKAGWFRQWLERPAGIPSHDPFSRVFRLLDASAFQAQFMKWVEATVSMIRDQVRAVDGKMVRGSRASGIAISSLLNTV